MSLQGCWHLWKVTEIRKTFLSRKRQVILPPSKMHKRRSGELQAAQPCFSPQECYRISHYGRCSRHKKYQVMGSNQVNANSSRAHSAWCQLSGAEALWQRGHHRYHSPWLQQGFHWCEPQQPDGGYKLLGGWRTSDPLGSKHSVVEA